MQNVDKQQSTYKIVCAPAFFAPALACDPIAEYEHSGQALFENSIGQLVTVRELARRLACSEKTIRDWVLKGLIPTVRPMPRMVRFDVQAIDRWLSERRYWT